MSVVPITSSDLKTSEVSWFSALCSDDYQFLGVPDGVVRPVDLDDLEAVVQLLVAFARSLTKTTKFV